MNTSTAVSEISLATASSKYCSALVVPATSSLADGVVVPIPTLPIVCLMIRHGMRVMSKQASAFLCVVLPDAVVMKT